MKNSLKILFIAMAHMFSILCFSQNFHLLVGTYTNNNSSKGIYVYRFNAATGAAEWVSNTEGVVNPSYLVASPNGKYVYAVNETGGTNPGAVSSFSFDHRSGQLTYLNSQPSGGDNPCYITTDKSGKWVVAGNYSGGNLALFQTLKNGGLQPYTQLIQHIGKGVNKERQESPHVHSTVFSPDGNYLFTPDLGLDKVFIYQFKPTSKKPLIPAPQPFVKTGDGNGPRHFTFHPNKKYAYLIEEMSGTVACYKYSNGRLIFFQRIATHPADFKGTLGDADIHISPDGKFLYTSNRGDENAIAIFSIQSSGKLVWKGYESTLGLTPRNFMIDPTGNFLLVANQKSNSVAIFRRNLKSGLLRYTGKSIDVPSPVCLQMLK
ncbi:MAG: lactonase family protein [Chitinophagaceae bacterium]